MNGPDVSALSPTDVVAALRSFPRRFGAVLAGSDPEEAEQRARHPDSSGHNALDWAHYAARHLALANDALGAVLVRQNAELPAAVMTEEAREWPHPSGGITAATDYLRVESEALAATVETIEGEQWTRTGEVWGGGTATALAIAREAVRTAASALRAAERATIG